MDNSPIAPDLEGRPPLGRRRFVGGLVRNGLLCALGGLVGHRAWRYFRGDPGTCGEGCGGCPAAASCAIAPTAATLAREWVYQIDPAKCVQCGRCATTCVLTPSAVKCVHSFDLCGYCDLCSGYFMPEVVTLDTGAENQLCPTGALRRRFIEDPYFEYTIDLAACIGCGKCVKGCTAFGNGSLYLQILHDRCVHCNQCTIARQCPADAIRLAPARAPYLLKQGRSIMM